MTRHLLLTAALLLAAPAAWADDPKDKAPNVDGTWVPVSGMMAGQALPDNFLSTTKLILAGNKYTVVVGEGKEDGTCKWDYSKKPATIDITAESGPNKGKTIPALVEVSGDTMKVIYNIMGDERPKDFNSTAQNKFVMMTYKRDGAKNPDKGKDGEKKDK